MLHPQDSKLDHDTGPAPEGNPGPSVVVPSLNAAKIPAFN